MKAFENRISWIRICSILIVFYFVQNILKALILRPILSERGNDRVIERLHDFCSMQKIESQFFAKIHEYRKMWINAR